MKLNPCHLTPKLRIDFRNCKTNKVLIKGLNGSGKSTLYNALNILPESNDLFIQGVEARKNICVDNNGVIFTIRYIHGVDNNGNRSTNKGYISKIIDFNLSPRFVEFCLLNGIDENNKVILLLTYNSFPNITNPNIIQISSDEYDALKSELIANSKRKKEE